ncbi:hypothetical protein CYMTET_36137, partial [Cymbomonas tetramitiformis]
MTFANEDTVYAVGEKDTVIKSLDGGLTWSTIGSCNLGQRYAWHGVSFWNVSRGWLVGSYGSVCVTHDGGDTWEEQHHGSVGYVPEDGDGPDAFEFFMRAVQVTGPEEVFVVGDEGHILHTVDGGVTWTQQVSRAEQDLYTLAFVSPSIGWVGGAMGDFLLHTRDGGTTWDYQPLKEDASPTAVQQGFHLSPTAVRPRFHL